MEYSLKSLLKQRIENGSKRSAEIPLVSWTVDRITKRVISHERLRFEDLEMLLGRKLYKRRSELFCEWQGVILFFSFHRVW